MADRNAYVKEGLTGGGLLDLDGIATADLVDGDICYVFASGNLYLYKFDATSVEAELNPTYIRPDDYTTAGVWEVFPIFEQVAINTGDYVDTAGDSAPSGCLVCDGAAYSRTIYDTLFAVIGTMYGEGDGSTTFNVPNWSGYGIRCWDNGAGVDLAADARTDRGDGTTGDYNGTVQPSSTKLPTTSFGTDTDQHRHSITLYGYGEAASGTGKTVIRETATWYTAYDSHNHTVNSGGDAQTAMDNRNQLRCIKY